MGDVPEDLVTLVNYLGSVKKKNFIVILRAAILVSTASARDRAGGPTCEHRR